jgi:hypothetical protein
MPGMPPSWKIICLVWNDPEVEKLVQGNTAAILVIIFFLDLSLERFSY